MPQNAREMMTILMAVHALAPLVKKKTLQIGTDNISAMANINHMGGQNPLLTLREGPSSQIKQLRHQHCSLSV